MEERWPPVYVFITFSPIHRSSIESRRSKLNFYDYQIVVLFSTFLLHSFRRSAAPRARGTTPDASSLSRRRSSTRSAQRQLPAAAEMPAARRPATTTMAVIEEMSCARSRSHAFVRHLVYGLRRSKSVPLLHPPESLLLLLPRLPPSLRPLLLLLLWMLVNAPLTSLTLSPLQLRQLLLLLLPLPLQLPRSPLLLLQHGSSTQKKRKTRQLNGYIRRQKKRPAAAAGRCHVVMRCSVQRQQLPRLLQQGGAML